MSNKLSPMMQYYLSLKEQYKEEIVFFRLGDFYEMFFDDAIKASSLLGLTLTGRDCGMEERAPMCGIPYHAADAYIAKLIAAGEKVAICEQLTLPEKGVKLVERGVVRVITSGTATDENSLVQNKPNYLASAHVNGKKIGIAWVDITTGELCALETDNDSASIDAVLSSLMPSEIICDTETHAVLNDSQLIATQRVPFPGKYSDNKFRYDTAYNAILAQLKVESLAIYECEGNKSIVPAIGALLAYVTQTQMRELSQINDLKIVNDKTYMILDPNTRRNLELTANARDGKTVGSLLWAIDMTKTAMGGRLLRVWLERPLKNEKQINLRLDAVEELLNNNPLRVNLIDELSVIRDIERLICKVPNNNCTPRDLQALGETLGKLPNIKSLLTAVESAMLINCRDSIDDNAELAELLLKAICDEPPINIREGGFIRNGFHAELDDLRDAKSIGAKQIAALEVAEREKTGIKTLKIRYNRMQGYYIEVPRAAAEKVPFNYKRRHTTLNSERFITDELSAIEENVLTADERAVKLELEIFNKLKEGVLSALASLQATAKAIAKLDVLQSFANIARLNDYVKPNVADKNKSIEIKNGRHAIVEKNIGRNYFTPNDTFIDNGDNRTMLITGPNMSGKSTYMRQVACIVLMAQIGSFVPAESASLPVTDRIFTRIGASDDLMSGQSTFMVEMVEVATIIKNCTDDSLVILDEIGRGTSTCDGLSIAWAIIEHLSKTRKCKTLICTHYHELTQLENVLSGIRNYKVNVTEIGGKVVFTHKISSGGANRSFGIEVAELAGIPDCVTKRASVILAKLEKNSENIDVNSIMLGSDNAENLQQVSFIADSYEKEVCNKLRMIDVDSLTPMQALVEIDSLKRMLKN